jgi:hypothetical protein
MNEKHKVIAGFEPNPAKKYPAPIKKTLLANTKITTPTVHNAHEICIANFLPKLSAMNGIIKKPNKLPIKTIDCNIVEVLSQSIYGSNSNMILFG